MSRTSNQLLTGEMLTCRRAGTSSAAHGIDNISDIQIEQVRIEAAPRQQARASQMERMTIDNCQTLRLAPSVWFILFGYVKERTNLHQFPIQGNHCKTP